MGTAAGEGDPCRPRGPVHPALGLLAYINAAFYARMVRGNLIETMNEDYIRTAGPRLVRAPRDLQARPPRGLTPVVTMLGLDIGLLLGGAFITETVFGLPGSGKAVQAIGTNDFPTVMGVTILGAFIIAVANLVVDVAYAFVDPGEVHWWRSHCSK